jgi:hypothetical protein
MKKHPVLDALQKASKGLLFVSETEAELEPFLWGDGGDLTRERLVKLAGAAEGTPVEETGLDSFFRAVPGEDKAKFQKLTKVLHEQLSGVKVYQLGGEAERQAYIVGKTPDGQWAGLKTFVVET